MKNVELKAIFNCLIGKSIHWKLRKLRETTPGTQVRCHSGKVENAHGHRADRASRVTTIKNEKAQAGWETKRAAERRPYEWLMTKFGSKNRLTFAF